MSEPVDAPPVNQPNLRGSKTMQKVTSEISMSLDGFITDPNAGVGSSLEGHDPGRLHDWMFDAETETDAAIRHELYGSTGAVLMGKRMFDVGFEPWGDPPLDLRLVESYGRLYCADSYVRMTPPVPVVLEPTRRSFAICPVSLKSRLPLPSRMGYTVRKYSSTRSALISV